MPDGTRIIAVRPELALHRNTGGTRRGAQGLESARTSLDVFRSVHRELAAAVRAQPRAGLFVFAVHRRLGLVGQLWLEAGDVPRAGVLGRHDGADLALPLDEGLSLRHVLFVVRTVAGRVRFTTLDLASSNGLTTEAGLWVPRQTAEEFLSLSMGDFVLFCIPSGSPLPWTVTERRPALPRARLVREPVSEGLAGRLVLGRGGNASADEVSHAALAGGILLGRDRRCDVVIADVLVSRVHAVLLTIGEQAFIIDAGSTNGVHVGDRFVRVFPLEPGLLFHLGGEVSVRWEAVVPQWSTPPTLPC